jgi:hypothetical protein
VLSAGQRAWQAALTATAVLAAVCGLAAAPTAASLESRAVAERPVEIRDYWTRQRMRAAIPAGRRLSRHPPASSPRALPRGSPTYVPGTPPSGGAAAARLRPGLVTSPAVRRAAIDVSADSAAFPRRVHGKVFLTLGDTDYFCSATVVSSAAHTVVWTAGHCVHGADIGLGFASNWMFVPAYRDGQAPYGSWTAIELITTDGWQSGANLRLDIGAALLARDPQGRGVQDVLGALGIAFHQPRNKIFDAYGYPAIDQNTVLFPPNFNGERLFRCRSPLTANDRPPGSGPETMEIDCDMTAGASGGGWVIADQFVNSVTSYGYSFNPHDLYGPYFGSVAEDLYRRASGPPLRCAGEAVTNLGGPGGDNFSGGFGTDAFRLERGPDEARGQAGRDVACGGGGDDRLRGGADRDVLRGQGGDDLLVGGPGRDVCVGGSGHDAARSCDVRRDIP